MDRKLGKERGLCPVGGGARFASNTMLATTDMGQKLKGCAFFPEEGELGPHIAQRGLGRGLPPRQVTSSSIQPFGHNRHGPKIGGSAPPPFWGRGAGSPSNTMFPGSRPKSPPSGVLIHPAVWPQQIWAENWEGAMPLWGGGAGSPSNTMWPGPRPTRMPSFILIHPTVWPQYTNVTDRTDRQDRTRQSGQTDNGLIA